MFGMLLAHPHQRTLEPAEAFDLSSPDAASRPAEVSVPLAAQAAGGGGGGAGEPPPVVRASADATDALATANSGTTSW